LTLQGGSNAYGSAVLEGVRLQFEIANAAGGVLGRRLALRTLDDDNKASQAEANARRLVADGAFVLFGCIEGGPSTAVAKVAEELRVPLFGPMAGSPSLRRPHSPMVFPVRAEHREEFRALMTWGQRTGLKTVAFFHADGDVGRQHLENVNLLTREMGLTVVLPMPFKSDITDAQLDEMARRLAASNAGMVFNHGSPGLYAKLVQKTRALVGTRNTFMAVNSGSSQLASTLGPLAHGMVFSQVVPSPWERKHAIARDYQDAVRRLRPDLAPSYGSLEGFLTARALVLALAAAGRDLSRSSFTRALERWSTDLGGVKVRYAAGDHEGSHFVDLSIVNRDGRFIH
jgi:branched-chain amino acid transport system substrate-binding protein